MGVIEIIKLIMELGGVLGLAVFAMWQLKLVWEARIAAEERHSAQLTSVWEETRDVVKTNTEALTRLCERLSK